MIKLKNLILESGCLKKNTILTLDKKYVVAGPIVDGRKVLDNVDNTSSIGSSLSNYIVLKGIRKVPMADFDVSGKHYSVSGDKRIQELARSIEYTRTIAPLIVVIDKDGPYVLEGSHRINALKRLNAKSFPALVVIDTDEI
jgi:hypothetical protein